MRPPDAVPLAPRKAGAMPSDRVRLLGLDFGSTTSSALIAEAQLGGSRLTGRMALEEPTVVFRSEPVFTPFVGEAIDEVGVAALIDGWLGAAGVAPAELFAGGALITGLAARRVNAGAIARLVGERVGEAVVAVADDPGLESWLAFMGSCATLSRFLGEVPVLNLDIGGGTTNVALGQAGNVQATGCWFLGARHFRFTPGGYRLEAITAPGAALLAHLGFDLQPGDTLPASARRAVLTHYVATLEAIVTGSSGPEAATGEAFAPRPLGRAVPRGARVTFSGGVGELVYRLVAGEALPATTWYGDLGIDLASMIAASPVLSRDLTRCVPEHRGRATVYGLTLHCTEVSGTTLFLPDPGLLPLRDLPIVARFDVAAGPAAIDEALALARGAPRGAAIQALQGPDQPFGLAEVRRLGATLAAGLRAAALPATQPLVLLLGANAGKTLGHYATEWGRLPVNLIVIDEVSVRNAHFVNIGRPHGPLVTVAYFGMANSA